MIKQCLSNKNEVTTVSFSKKKMELNKTRLKLVTIQILLFEWLLNWLLESWRGREG